MYLNKRQPIFENRYDAGHKLAAKLTEYRDQPVIVLAIPNGGVPVALGVAVGLQADLNLIISRKIPLPLCPEGGFGAVTDDGTIILNEELVKKAGLTREQIDHQVNKVRADIRHRSILYHEEKPPLLVRGKTIILVDDGLASGITAQAAIASVRRRRPKEVVVAVPVASAVAVEQVAKVADKIVACVTDSTLPFYVADFFGSWHDTSDEEVLQCLKECRVRRSLRSTPPDTVPPRSANLFLR